jgi:hypothetical protein
MADPHWLEQMARHLDRRQVPKPWRRRLLEELRDHLADLEEERRQDMATEALEARMGDAEAIADLAGAEYRKLGFWRRRPALTFLLGPLLAAVLAMAAYFLMWAGLAQLALGNRPDDVPLSAREVWVLRAVTGSVPFVPFAAVACLFGWLARRWLVRAAWLLAGCAVLGLLAGQMHTVIQSPAPNAPHGQVMIGLALNLGHLTTHLAQAAAPVLVGAAFLLRRRPMAA